MGIREAINEYEAGVQEMERLELQIEELNKLGHKLASQARKAQVFLRKAAKAPLPSMPSQVNIARRALGEVGSAPQGMRGVTERMEASVDQFSKALSRASAAI